MVACTKRQVIDHIHRLLVIQLKRTGETQWKCVVRDGQIKLILPPFTNPSDIVIVDYFMDPDSLPLKTLIQRSINKNWDTLSTIDIKM